MLKPGRAAVDPLGRTVTVLRLGTDASGAWAEVRLAGPYAATVRYPPSCLRPLEDTPEPV